MKQIKIRDKEYNCSNKIYYHIQGLESENRLFNMEIKGHEQRELELQKRLNKAIEYIEQQRDRKTRRLDTRLNRVSKILQGVDKE